jgi:hypothetical protein
LFLSTENNFLRFSASIYTHTYSHSFTNQFSSYFSFTPHRTLLLSICHALFIHHVVLFVPVLAVIHAVTLSVILAVLQILIHAVILAVVRILIHVVILSVILAVLRILIHAAILSTILVQYQYQYHVADEFQYVPVCAVTLHRWSELRKWKPSSFVSHAARVFAADNKIFLFL